MSPTNFYYSMDKIKRVDGNNGALDGKYLSHSEYVSVSSSIMHISTAIHLNNLRSFCCRGERILSQGLTSREVQASDINVRSLQICELSIFAKMVQI